MAATQPPPPPPHPDASDRFNAFWKHLPLPAPGTRPVLREEEVECLMRDQVEIVDGRSNRAIYQRGVVTLTSHRIIWYTETFAVEGHLSLVVHARKSNNIFRSSSRVHIFVLGQEDHRGEEAATKVDFRQGGRDDFLEALKVVLGRKEWQHAAANAPRANPSAEPIFAASKAGITGIIRQQERNRLKQDKLAAEAFTDLESLMGKARDVVAVIERYATVLSEKAKDEQQQQQGAGRGADTTMDDETRELQGLLLNMGIANPVTRHSAGTLYHQELARQLADFLKRGADLNKRGGMLTLPDVYCLFNRARGTELISPEDLLDSCKLLGSLKLGMQLRSFPSGVCVIQADEFDEVRVGERVRALADSKARLMAVDVATSLSVSITLAQEFLRAAESRGYLCRDEGAQGTLFYPNRFPDFVAKLPPPLNPIKA